MEWDGDVHVLAQAPQLLGSEVRSTHEPLQSVRLPQLVVQPPLEHTWPVEQVVPQAPQLVGSVCSSTQLPPQLSYPALQVNPHLPAEHVVVLFGGVGQTLPQLPQLSGSVLVARQLPAQLE